jgi:hypothetical protein
MDQFVVKFRPLPSATFLNTIKIYNATLTPLVPPFGNLFPVKDRQREVSRDFIKQCRHLSKTMIWHIYDFRFDKAPKNRADKFAIWWLNISHHAAIFTGPDTWIPQILSCAPLDGCPAVRAAPNQLVLAKQPLSTIELKSYRGLTIRHANLG